MNTEKDNVSYNNCCPTTNNFDNLTQYLDESNSVNIDIQSIDEFIFVDDLLSNNINIEEMEQKSNIVEECESVNECVTENHNTITINVDEGNDVGCEEINVYGKKKRKKDVRKSEKLCREK